MENNIRAIREERGISQQQCADDLGISVRTLQRYEKGETGKLEYCMKIAEYFNVSLNSLVPPAH